jgi:GGDEF domain-containing protein
MAPLAAAFWGGFFTVACLMLAVSIAAAVRGLWRIAVVGATFALVPALFVSAYIGLLPFEDPATHYRFLAHLTVFGAVGLALQLLVILRGYRKPTADQKVGFWLLVSGGALLAASWLASASAALWLSCGFALALSLVLIGLALRKALRGNRAAWISVAGVTLAVMSLASLSWIVANQGAVALAVHAAGATSSLAYIAIMGWAMWMRYSYALEMRQVLAQGPSFDPVTRLPSHAHTGKLVGSFLRSGAAKPLGVLAVSISNLPLLEQLHGRAAYNHALYVAAGRLRRCMPLGAQLGRLGEDGFLALVRSDDVELLKQLSARVRRSLTHPVHLALEPDAAVRERSPTEWVPDVGIGITLQREADRAAGAVATARAMSRAACAYPSRIVFAEHRDAPCLEVEVG